MGIPRELLRWKREATEGPVCDTVTVSVTCRTCTLKQPITRKMYNRDDQTADGGPRDDDAALLAESPRQEHNLRFLPYYPRFRLFAEKAPLRCTAATLIHQVGVKMHSHIEGQR